MFFAYGMNVCTFVLSIRESGGDTWESGSYWPTDSETFHEIIYGKPTRRKRAPGFFLPVYKVVYAGGTSQSRYAPSHLFWCAQAVCGFPIRRPCVKNFRIKSFLPESHRFFQYYFLTNAGKAEDFKGWNNLFSHNLLVKQ